ncbi:MAG: hypothetical protein SF123_01000 [Chloroflexota bacterium]|nr:hypothetical protein [Chloroflexota bacterium]
MKRKLMRQARETKDSDRSNTVRAVEAAPEAAHPNAHLLEMQRLYGNQAVQRMIQREPDAPTQPNLLPSPQGTQAAIEASYRPIRDWLTANVAPNALLSAGEVVRMVWKGCPDAQKISNAELTMLVEEWGRKQNVNFLPFPMFEGPGIEAVLTLKLPAPEVERKLKADAKGIKTEFEVEVAPRISFSASAGADKATMSATLDVMPDALKRVQDALKLKTKIGTFKLKFSSEVTAEIEAKAADADGKRKAEAALKGEGAAVGEWQIGQLPIFLKSEAKAGIEWTPDGVKPGAEFTPLKFEVKF